MEIGDIGCVVFINKEEKMITPHLFRINGINGDVVLGSNGRTYSVKDVNVITKLQQIPDKIEETRNKLSGRCIINIGKE